MPAYKYSRTALQRRKALRVALAGVFVCAAVVLGVLLASLGDPGARRALFGRAAATADRDGPDVAGAPSTAVEQALASDAAMDRLRHELALLRR